MAKLQRHIELLEKIQSKNQMYKILARVDVNMEKTFFVEIDELSFNHDLDNIAYILGAAYSYIVDKVNNTNITIKLGYTDNKDDKLQFVNLFIEDPVKVFTQCDFYTFPDIDFKLVEHSIPVEDESKFLQDVAIICNKTVKVINLFLEYINS